MISYEPEERRTQPRMGLNTTTCRALGCSKQIPASFDMCNPHWQMVPKPLAQALQRAKISLAARRRGEYVRALQAAQKAVLAAEQTRESQKVRWKAAGRDPRDFPKFQP